MSVRRNTVLLSALLLCASLVSVSAFVEELDDSFIEMKGDDEIWLIKFYAPWCHICRQLDPVWHQIGSELKSLGSPVNVGKSDATANPGLAKEFRVRSYPTILMLKKDMKYNYPGPRTKDVIMEFAHRVSGPLVRALTSLQLFQHAMSRHDVMFVYVGATSPLKGNFSAAAEELIVHTYFFSASRDVLPKAVNVSLPAVVVFKDGTYFTYSEERDGELTSWINRERFPNYGNINSYMLYAMGESGKLVLLVLVEEKRLSEESLRYKGLVEKVSADYRDIYSRNFYFGFMESSDYIKGLVMDEVVVPSFIVVNLTSDSYFLPPGAMETERHLLDFLDKVLDGSVKSQGGNGISQRIRRVVYDAKVALTPVFSQSPLLGCILVSFPFAVFGVFVFRFRRLRHAATAEDEDAPPAQRRQKLTDKKSD